MITLFIAFLFLNVNLVYGLLSLLVVLTFFLLFNGSCGLTLREFFSFDFLSYGILLLLLIIIFFIELVGYTEKLSFNNYYGIVFCELLLIFGLFMLIFSVNFFLFYLFFEFVVIPVFIMILVWGYRENRLQSGLYIFMYTLLSSLPLLISLIFIGLEESRAMFYHFFYFKRKFLDFYWWCFLIVVFIVKLPVFFLHIWLPKAHVDASILGSIILAGVLLKLGGFGIYKFFFLNFVFYKDVIIFLRFFSLIGRLFIGFMCLAQTDLKMIVAYSSVVHMGPVLRSLLLITYSGLIGSYLLIFSHGLCSSFLFFMLRVLYEKLGSRSLFLLRGGLFINTVFSFIVFLFCICNIGFPPSFSFFSELIVLLSSFFFSNIFMFCFFFVILLRGIYCIYLYIFMNHGFEKFKWFFYRVTLLDFFVSIIHLVLLLFFLLTSLLLFC